MEVPNHKTPDEVYAKELERKLTLVSKKLEHSKLVKELEEFTTQMVDD